MISGFLTQLGMNELEEDYSKKIAEFFEHLGLLIHISRKLVTQLDSLWLAEKNRIVFEARVVEELRGLLEALEPEVSVKKEDFESRVARVTSLLGQINALMKVPTATNDQQA